MTVKKIFWTIILGLVSGTLIGGYFLGLNQIGAQLSLHPGLVLLLPIVFLLIVAIRRHSDFFPKSFIEMREAQPSETQIWSRWTLPLNLILSWSSHLAGASLGRESTAATISTATISIFKLDWTYWRPIVLSASLAMATGHPWVALIIIIELFYSDFQQKFLTVLCAWVGCLVMKTFGVPALFQYTDYNVDNKSFLSALVLAFAVGIVCGYLGRFYKAASEALKNKFQNHRTRLQIAFSFLLALVLAFAMIKFNLAAYQSLSLPLFADIQSGKVHVEFAVLKGLLTLLCVALGFIGGEFVPSLLIGSAIGVSLTSVFSENVGFGFALGLFSFFAALSKMKWTAVFLVWSYFDFGTAMWAYFSISLSDSLSGDKKLF